MNVVFLANSFSFRNGRNFSRRNYLSQIPGRPQKSFPIRETDGAAAVTWLTLAFSDVFCSRYVPRAIIAWRGGDSAQTCRASQ